MELPWHSPDMALTPMPVLDAQDASRVMPSDGGTEFAELNPPAGVADRAATVDDDGHRALPPAAPHISDPRIILSTDGSFTDTTDTSDAIAGWGFVNFRPSAPVPD